MDMTVKQCIDQLYNVGKLTECNYAALCETVDVYHEAYARIKNCKSKYLVGEQVYVEKDYFDKTNKNHVALMEIESISYDIDKKTFLYNFLYKEDECYATVEDLLASLKSKYYSEYESKVHKACEEIKMLGKEGDSYAK